MTDDGRNIDSESGSLVGEAAGQHSVSSVPVHVVPALREADGLSYYGLPLLQQPVWKWMIPAYYFVGGLSGAALVLGAAVQLRDDLPERDKLTRRCHWIGFTGCGVSAVLLIADLGKHERFLNMLRVFRPTSPMNMGAWILNATAGATTLAMMARGGLKFLFTLAAGVLGSLLATYTGVLLGVTAVPVWQESRRVLPVLFGGSALSSLGSVLNLLPGSVATRRIAGTIGSVGQATELIAAAVMEHEAAGRSERLARPFQTGLGGAMWRTAAVLTAGSVVLAVLPGRSRTKRVATGVLGVLGSALMRFAVEQLGKASAADARAAFEQQRGTPL